MAIQGLIGVTVFAHFAVLVFLLFGGFLAWRWGWVIVPHVVMAGWAALIVTAPVNCPLTALENFLRARAGESPLAGGFIDTYLTGVLYPTQDVVLVRWLVALVVLTSWVGAFIRWQHDRGTRSHRVGFGG
jgi:hypothetical protein